MRGFHDISDAQEELLHPTAHARANNGLVEVDLRLGQSCFRTCLLGWKKGGDARLRSLFCCGGGRNRPLPALDGEFQFLDVTESHHARVATLQLLLRFQFVQGLLVANLGLLDLAFRGSDIGLRDRHLRLDLGNLLSRGVNGRFLFRAVQPEDRLPLFYMVAYVDISFGDAPARFGNDRNRSEVRDDVVCGRVVVKYYRDQPDGEHEASRDAPPELEPDGV